MLPRPEVDRSSLERIVAASVGSPGVEVVTWRQESIHAAFNQATGGLFRLTGTARDGRVLIPWSVILKVVHASNDTFGGSLDPRDANYWKREPLLYRSGALEDLDGIRAPRCLGVQEFDDDSARVWLEDAGSPDGSRWPRSRYRLASRRLGQFNGTYLAGRPLPLASHLSRDWLRATVGTYEAHYVELPSIRRGEIARRCWPSGLLDRLLRLWADRHRLLHDLDRLPQTFCHLDAFPRNLLVHGATREVVAVDWSYAGVAPVGSELAPMVAASVSFFDADPSEARAIDDTVFDGYMDGLIEVGWDGDPAVVGFGYAASAALRYGLFPLGIFLSDPRLRERFERLFSRPAETLCDRWAEVVTFLLDRADETRTAWRRVLRPEPARRARFRR